jgi:hypothetical protein
MLGRELRWTARPSSPEMPLSPVLLCPAAFASRNPTRDERAPLDAPGCRSLTLYHAHHACRLCLSRLGRLAHFRRC